MRSVFVLMVVLITISSQAQTRRIAHRTHSGAKQEKYSSVEGSYGRVSPSKVKVHLESGRDTMVSPWDSLARPYYYDTLPRAIFRPIDRGPKADIREMGNVTGRMIM